MTEQDGARGASASRVSALYPSRASSVPPEPRAAAPDATHAPVEPLDDLAPDGPPRMWILGAAAGLAIGLIALVGLGVQVVTAGDGGAPTSPSAQAPTEPAPQSQGPSAPVSQIPLPDGVIPAGDLSKGQCIADPYLSAYRTEDGQWHFPGHTVVDCALPHYGEVYLVTSSARASYDSWEVFNEADLACKEAFEGYIGNSYEASGLYFDAYYPSEDLWAAGDRSIVCAVTLMGQDLVGTVAGSGL